MSPDAVDLLAWMAGRPGEVLIRDFEAAPRRFRRASVYGPLVAELLAAGRIEQTGERPRTYAVVGTAGPAAASPSPASRLPAMLADAVADCADLPAELASWWGVASLRDSLVARLLASKGLAVDPAYAQAARSVDDAMVRAFDCTVPD